MPRRTLGAFKRRGLIVRVTSIGCLVSGGGVAVSEGWPSDTNARCCDPSLCRPIFPWTARSAEGMTSAGHPLDSLVDLMDAVESDAALVEAKEKGTTSIEELIQELGL